MSKQEQADVAPTPNSSAGSSSTGGGSRSRVPGQDCLACRMIGMAFGVGGGGYLMSQLIKEPAPKGAHRYAIVGTAATMFALGMYRALG